MKLSHLSWLTTGMLLGENLMIQARANLLCPREGISNNLPYERHCLPNTAANSAPDLMASISQPEFLNYATYSDGFSPVNAENQQLVSWLNSPSMEKAQELSHRQMSNTLLLNFLLAPIGALAFLWLIKPWIVQIFIKEIRQEIAELDKLECQLNQATQKAETLAKNFHLKIEDLAAEFEQGVGNWRRQLNQQGLSAQQFEAIKSDWLTQLQHLVLEVYDARDQALEKIAKINPDTLMQKAEQSVQQYQNRLRNLSKQGLMNSGEVRVEDCLKQGNQLLQQGYYAEALLAYNKAISLSPNHADAWYHRGNALGCLQQYSAALAAYDRALAWQPERAEFWANRGHILVKLQQDSEALASYDKAISLQPENPEYWQHKGNLLARLQKYAEALTAYEKASLLAPEKYEVWHLKGNLLAKLQQTEQAVIAYKQAVTIDPKKYESWYNLGNGAIRSRGKWKAKA